MGIITTGRALGALLLAVSAGSAQAEVVQIRIANLAFTPPQVAAHVGDTVEWVNGDFVAHTATARDGAWDILIPPNSNKSVVLKAAGDVDYYCKFHPQMTGKITVAQ